MRSLDIAAQSQLDALELEHVLQICPLRQAVAAPLTEAEFDSMLKSLSDMESEFDLERITHADATSLLPNAAMVASLGHLAAMRETTLGLPTIKPRLA